MSQERDLIRIFENSAKKFEAEKKQYDLSAIQPLNGYLHLFDHGNGVIDIESRLGHSHLSDAANSMKEAKYIIKEWFKDVQKAGIKDIKIDDKDIETSELFYMDYHKYDKIEPTEESASESIQPTMENLKDEIKKTRLDIGIAKANGDSEKEQELRAHLKELRSNLACKKQGKCETAMDGNDTPKEAPTSDSM